MRVLQFNVKGQRLTYQKSEPIIRGTSGYLQAAFNMSPEWDSLRVAAQFFDVNGTEFAVLLKDGKCMVSDAVTQGPYFKVSLIGMKNYVLTTNKVTIRQEV